MKFFRTVKGSELHKDIQKLLEHDLLWAEVSRWAMDKLGEPNITGVGMTTRGLFVDVNELEKEKNKKLFKKDGFLKKNSKETKVLNQEFLDKLEELGLSDYESKGHILFKYGLLRRRLQKQETFGTQEGIMYFKSNADWTYEPPKTVEEITEIEYEEAYLSELKKQEGE